MIKDFTIKPRGKIDAKYVVVGDCPKPDEVQNRLAFDSSTYELLVDLLDECGVKESDVLFVNCTQIARRSGKITPEELKNDAEEFLLPLINAYPRDLVLVMGNNALCATNVTKKPEKINSLKGSIVHSESITTAKAIVPLIHPYSVLKEPDLVDEFISHANFAFRVCVDVSNAQAQAPVYIIDLETVEDFDMLFEAVEESKIMAYDFETTGIGRKDYPISCAFATGHKTEDNEHVVFFWASHDKMVPRFSPEVYNQMIDKLAELFENTDKVYKRIAWNKAFDDVMAERLVKRKLPSSTKDAMIMKWSVNSRRPHDLKTNTARYLGYANYDKAVDDAVKEVASRRNRILTEQEDFDVLEMFGHVPEKTKTGYKWTKGVDKKLAAYAMIDFATLRLYNAYDAVYTLLLHNYFDKIIKRDNLSYSNDFRHRVSYRLVEAENRGLLLDVETNRKFSKELKEISESCQRNIVNELAKMGINAPDFNIASSDQLGAVLYGEPVSIPSIDVDAMIDRYDWNPDTAYDKCGIFMDEFYDNGSWIKPLVKVNEYDYNTVAVKFSAKFNKKFGFDPILTPVNIYIMGRHEPEAFTKTGKPSTAGAILTTIYERNPEEPFLSMVLLKRKVDKMRSTFIDAIYESRDENNVVRCRYNVIGTDTGRISSHNFNSQNLNAFIRGQFIARPGYNILQFDLSQAEVRAVAAFSGDQNLIKAFTEGDIHSNIASVIYKCDPKDVTKEQRRFTKTVVFGIIYGRGAYALSLALGCSKEEAQEFIDKFFSTFPDLKNWLDEQKKLARRKPYYIYTPWGTRRSTRNILSTDKAEVAHIERISQNMPIQGAAGELTLWYICEILDAFEEAGIEGYLVNTTHDSVALEIPCEYAYSEVTGVDDNGKEIKIIKGKAYNIVSNILNATVPIEPLDKVKFAADIDLSTYWECKPDLLRAIDPEKGGEKSLFRWDIIKAEEVMDKEELAEFMDVLNVMD